MRLEGVKFCSFSDLQPPALPLARVSAATDDAHGKKVRDPYRWLEDAAAPETARLWDEKEKAYTRNAAKDIPGRDELRKRIESLLTIGRGGALLASAFTEVNVTLTAGKNQAVVWRARPR